MRSEHPTLLGSLERLARHLGGADLTPGEAYTHPWEDVLIRYVIGRGRFSSDGKFSTIDARAFKLNGDDDGTYVGVDEHATWTSGRPQRPTPPFDAPTGPIEHVIPQSFSKGLRTFPDGSTLTAVGTSNLHIAMYADGAGQFWVTSNLIVTNGTGRYAGAQGLKTVAGSTWVEPGKELTQLREFSVKTVEVYRIVRREFIARPRG